MNNNPYTNLTLSPSPFHLEDGWCVLKENKNKNCTHAEIDTLSAKGLLNSVDFAIMKLLSAYPFINTYNLEYALLHKLPEFYQKEEYTRNLRKLVKAGILIKFCIADKTKGENPVVVSPLRFYSLSPGAYSYMSSFADAPHGIQFMLNDLQIVELLSVAQLLIHAKAAYPNAIKQIRFCTRKKVGNKQMMLHAHFIYHEPETLAQLNLLLLSGRSLPASHEELTSNICTLYDWLDKNNETFRNYMILLILETLHDIPTIQELVSRRRKTGKMYPLYYALDTNLLTHDLFDCIYQCEELDETPHIDRVHFRINRTDY